MEHLQYPIGRFQPPSASTEEERQRWIDQIAAAPVELRQAVEGLTIEQLQTPYRPGGWTVRQVAHHIPDSHLNGYVRVKLALTEAEPTIKPYEEALWAELPDVQTTAIEISLSLLESLHHRWVLLWKALAPQDFKKTFRHPELGLMNLEKQLALYSWHGRHHIAQITSLRERMGW